MMTVCLWAAADVLPLVVMYVWLIREISVDLDHLVKLMARSTAINFTMESHSIT
jgi:hypothetical protein